jgi:hypothetical protein
MLQSTPQYNGAPGPTSPAIPQVTGPVRRGYLGHKRPAWERSDLAAMAYVQKRPIEAPTQQLWAFAYRVSVASIRRRLNGKPGNGRNGHAESLAQHIARSSPAERLEAARVLGIENVWDQMIAPVIAEDRAAAETATTA